MVNVCTVNVGVLRGRSRELVEMLRRRRIVICCIHEVRYRNERATIIGTENEKYKFWYSVNEIASNGVGTHVHQDMVHNVVEVKGHSDRIIQVKLVFGNNIYHVISIYALRVGLTAEEKGEFWEKLEDLVSVIQERDFIIVGGDLNGYICHSTYGYEDLRGVHGLDKMNEEGKNILKFCKNQNLKTSNTYFQKPREKLITYKSGVTGDRLRPVQPETWLLGASLRCESWGMLLDAAQTRTSKVFCF